MPTLRYGKFKGKDIRDAPAEYLEFLLESAERTRVEVREELARRRSLEEADLSWAQQIIETGYRELARRHHPDLVGGDGKAMRSINATVEALRQAVRDK